jgi:hypothetical protein
MPPPVSNANRLTVLKLKADNPDLTASQIALRVGLSTRTVEGILEGQSGQEAEAAGSEEGVTFQMNSTDELEEMIEGWPYPWPELLGMYKQVRDDKIAHAHSEADKKRAIKEYGQRVLEMIARGRGARPI